MEKVIGAYEARRKFGQLIEEAWERNKDVPSSEIEKDVQEGIETLKKEPASRRAS